MKSSTPHSKFLFALFFVSGFCGLLYQIVWVRLAYASFGITTPVLSVVLSVFMAGLALGSWLAGRFTSRNEGISGRGFLRFYALSEGLIGLGGLCVPFLFRLGETFLLPLGTADSSSYLFSSALALFFSLIPWCFAMGTTFPLMMAFLKKSSQPEDSFSFLYTANVLGAMTGTLATLFLVELFGFRGTLWTATFLNASIALLALLLAKRAADQPSPNSVGSPHPRKGGKNPAIPLFLPILFTTGFTSMAMEVVWTRDFTVVLSTQVYSFAALLFTYLLATFGGSWFYRWEERRDRVRSVPFLLGLTFPSALLTVVLNDMRIQITVGGVLFSIIPFCAVLGYLTPRLVDLYSKGDPQTASRAYAVNILGCILGPLAASYLLLPILGVRLSLVLLSLPFLFFILQSLAALHWKSLPVWILGGVGAGLLALALGWSVDYEESYAFFYPSFSIHRDYTATVVSCGTGRNKRLLVNGIGITSLVQATKMMAHLPLAYLPHPPQSALDICFGMGTTFRALAHWNIRATAVDLVPSVPKAFGYYHDDAAQILANPNCRVVVDDGKRFLQRTHDRYDVITIDPPPPLEAAGSSLLYSTEFYQLAKTHLQNGGILAQWCPPGELATVQAIARSLTQVFPYVKAFGPRTYGLHFLASDSPLTHLTPDQLLQKMPPSAREDLAEWYPTLPPAALFDYVVSKEVVLSSLLNPDPQLVITKDRPYNEYFLLRRLKYGLNLF